MSKKIAVKWFKQTLHDLQMAERNIEIEGYDVSAFLAHQAVEKLIKSIFAIKGKKMPKIHYVDELAKKLGLDKDVIDLVSELTVDYTFRYPDVAERMPYEEYNEETAIQKVRYSKEIF
jgi:HEPN domain-containing protein